MITPKQENIEYLLGQGFEICPWEVTYYKFAGSTQLGRDPRLNFYVGADYVFGQHDFFQHWRDIRLIDDTITLLALTSGLGLPNIEEDSEPEGHYSLLGYRDAKAEPVLQNILSLEKLVREKFMSISPSSELSKIYEDYLGDRFVGQIFDVLQPVPECGKEIETYAAREAKDRRELTDQMAHLMHAVEINSPQMFTSIIGRIKFLGLKCDYDPETAINNIISGKYRQNSD